MFKYNYPSSKIENKIVILHSNGNVTVCTWQSKLKQWVDESKPIDYGTISYLEYDERISSGSVHWCYYSVFKRFMSINQILNIEKEL